VKSRVVIILAALILVSFFPLISRGQESGQGGSQGGTGQGMMGPGMYRGAPYGHFCPGPGWGPYGARKPVRTMEEAKEILAKYFSASGKSEVKIGTIEQKRWYFEAEILDLQGNLVDRAIVDRRTGRIRSIY
jgi:hypothetical protein